MPTDPIQQSKSNPLAALMWAIYLGVSWTWVIGMFLPVLLVRDFGLLGWVVFAVPNVIGAAAMGWVLRDAAASERFVRKHASACRAFSLVTIAYHIFFAAWMIERLRGWGWIALLAFAMASILPQFNLTRWGLAIFALVASTAAWLLMYQQQSALMLPPMHPRSGLSPASAGFLLPVFLIGFGLCPYLDLTFHRARQSTSVAGGRFAFGFGFGVVFFAMIVFTLLYARWLAPAVDGNDLGKVSTMFLCIHLIAQSAFTVSAHVRELSVGGRGNGISTGAGITFILGALGIGMWTSTPHRFGSHDAGEAVYWCLLGFYGTIFPAYLLSRGSRDVLVLGAISLAAFPFYWMGFVERRPALLIVGVFIVLASRLFTKRIQIPASDERVPGPRPNGLRLGSRGMP